MSLKDLTLEKHKAAESTRFMQAVIQNQLPAEVWADWCYQRHLVYTTLEGIAGSLGLLSDLPGIQRAFLLYKDYHARTNRSTGTYTQTALRYQHYLLSIDKDADLILAHVYTWHMGDLYGGQMIKRIIPGPHYSLEFVDKDKLLVNLRGKLHDGLAKEANKAFDFAIGIMDEVF